MGIQRLIGRFKGRVDKDDSMAFIATVEAVATFDNKRKWVTPLPQLPSEKIVGKKLKKPKRK
jgi:transcription initiation factor TFIIF subunit alpha